MKSLCAGLLLVSSLLLIACGSQDQPTEDEPLMSEPLVTLEAAPPQSEDVTLPAPPQSEDVTLPEPTGSYDVGRKLFHLVDPLRPEPHTPNPDDPREIIVDIWYPADLPSGASPGPYVSPGTAESMGISDDVNQSLAHAVLGAPLADADAPFPVIIFNPGFSALHTEYTALIEDLASHGYVVISIAHPYVTGMTVLPGGRIASYAGEDSLTALWAPTDPYVAELYQMWLPDTMFILSQLPGLNDPASGTLFASHLDLSTVGFMGHSFGGRTAVEICRVDDSCGAAINMDGGLTETALDEGLPVPYMAILAGGKAPEQTVEMVLMFQKVENDSYMLTVQGSTHYSFGDGYFVGEAIGQVPPSSAEYGSIGSTRMITVVRSYSLAFFNQYLQGINDDLLSGPSDDFPEVEFEARYLED